MNSSQAAPAKSARSRARGRRAGRTADGVHDRQRGGARRDGEDNRTIGALAESRNHASNVAALVVNEAIHRDDVIENGRAAGSSMSPTAKRRVRRLDRSARAPARARTSVGEMSIAKTSAPRFARSIASAPEPQPASRSRKPHAGPAATRTPACAHLVTAGAHGGANAADGRVRGQSLPRFDRGAVEIGFEFVLRRLW